MTSDKVCDLQGPTVGLEEGGEVEAERKGRGHWIMELGLFDRRARFFS